MRIIAVQSAFKAFESQRGEHFEGKQQKWVCIKSLLTVHTFYTVGFEVPL